MFTIRFTNFGHSPNAWPCKELDDVIAVAKQHCFDATILKDGQTVGHWSPIGGYRRLISDFQHVAM
jgi:hypothetical protein